MWHEVSTFDESTFEGVEELTFEQEVNNTAATKIAIIVFIVVI